MSWPINFITLTLFVLLCVISVDGCTEEAPTANNSTPLPNTIPDAPTIIPGLGAAYTAYGRVYLDGNIVSGAQVEAMSVDGTYRTSNTTDKNGVYQLVLPDNKEYNVTAKYQGLQHKLWPVLLKGESASYNIYMTSAPKSVVRGHGSAAGGPLGFDASKFNFSGFVLKAVPANINATITTTANSDGSYYMEVEPGVRYRMDVDTMAGVWFNLRNTDRGGLASWHGLNVTPGTDETVLVDYHIALP